MWYTYQNNDNYRSNKGPDKLSVIPQPAPEEERRGGRGGGGRRREEVGRREEGGRREGGGRRQGGEGGRT